MKSILQMSAAPFVLVWLFIYFLGPRTALSYVLVFASSVVALCVVSIVLYFIYHVGNLVITTYRFLIKRMSDSTDR